MYMTKLITAAVQYVMRNAQSHNDMRIYVGISNGLYH